MNNLGITRIPKPQTRSTGVARQLASAQMIQPKTIQLIGEELAVIWGDDKEGYISGSALRAASPSAQTAGERDILGQLHGGEHGKNYSAVQIVRWEQVGNYAIRFTFSDGHSTGLYGYELLRQLTCGKES